MHCDPRAWFTFLEDYSPCGKMLVGGIELARQVLTGGNPQGATLLVGARGHDSHDVGGPPLRRKEAPAVLKVVSLVINMHTFRGPLGTIQKVDKLM